MKLNKLVLKFVSISFSILVMLLVVIGLIKLGSFCYDFGYRVFTEGPVEEKTWNRCDRRCDGGSVRISDW